MTEHDRFSVFFVVWLAAGAASAIFLWRGSPEAKRTWFPRIQVAAGMAFVLFVYWVTPGQAVLVILLPAVALITFLNVRFTKFCPNCGAYHQGFGALYRVNFSRKCGSPLSPGPPTSR